MFCSSILVQNILDCAKKNLVIDQNSKICSKNYFLVRTKNYWPRPNFFGPDTNLFCSYRRMGHKWPIIEKPGSIWNRLETFFIPFFNLIFLQIFQILLICHGFLAILALPAMEDLPDVEIIPSIDTSISTEELKQPRFIFTQAYTTIYSTIGTSTLSTYP